MRTGFATVTAVSAAIVAIFVATRDARWRLPAEIAAVVLVSGLIYLLPQILIPKSPNRRMEISEADRLQGVNALRSTMVQAVAGLLLLFGLSYTAQTLRTAQSTLSLNRQSEISSQFAQGVSALGEQGVDDADARAGGIYILGMLDNQARAEGGTIGLELHRTIFSILEDYLFQHDSLVYNQPAGQNRGTFGGPILDADFQAIVSVLTRSPHWPGTDRIELAELNLEGVDLRNAYLQGANLLGSDLFQAELSGSHLDGADLRDTCLLLASYGPNQLHSAVTDSTTITSEGQKLCGRAAS